MPRQPARHAANAREGSEQTEQPISPPAANNANTNASANENSTGATTSTTFSSFDMDMLLKCIKEAVAKEGELIRSYVTETTKTLDAKLDAVVKRLDDAVGATEALATRITEAEERVSKLEDELESTNKRLTHLEKLNKDLAYKVMDQETRQRRNNIRILNLQESSEGDDPVTFFEEFLPRLLGLQQKTIAIDRAHRGYGKPADDRPRPVILKLVRSRDTAAVLAAAKNRSAGGALLHSGRPIRVGPDTPPEVRAARRAFNGVCGKLIERNIRFRMAFPAVLSFKMEGTVYTFKEAKLAEDFLGQSKNSSAMPIA